jgi:LmbE family N-acetylglucosaminyl deacetylase
MTFPASAAPLSDVQRVLAVLAHPDDVDFGCAGTVSRWTADGIEVAYLVVTRGDAGGFDDTPRADMPGIREREQRAAAEVLGVRQVDFLDGYADGTVTPTPALRRDIAAAIRRFRPDRVVTTSPLRRWERIAGPSHPDHLAVGEAATCAIYPDARNRFAFPDLAGAGLEPWVVREVWYFGGPNPDHPVDITDQFSLKVAALKAHATQTSHIEIEAVMRERAAAVAETAGLPPGRLAEAFTVLRTE